MPGPEIQTPKAILLDLDATVQGPEIDAVPSAITAHWIRRAVDEKEIWISVLTGRSHKLAKRSLNLMGVNAMSAFDVGGTYQIPRTGAEFKRIPLTRESQLAALSVARSMDVGLYTSEQQFYGHPIVCRDEITADNPKLYAASLPPEKAEVFVGRLGEEVDGIAAYVSTAWGGGQQRDVHITNEAATKKQAAEYIIGKFLNLNPADVWFFGDGELDRPVIEMGEITSFAVANAPPEIRSAATHVTSAWYQNGVAEAICTRIFGEPWPQALTVGQKRTIYHSSPA